MRRFFAALVVGMWSLGAQPALVGAQDVTANPNPVRLGAVLSLTGSYASIGRQEEAALHIAESVVNRTNGIDGRPLQLIVADDHSAPADAVAAAHWMLDSVRPAAIIGGSYEATCSAMRDVTEGANVVQYCLSGAQTDTSTFFASFPAPGRAFGDLPAAWMKSRQLDQVGIVSSNDRAGRLYATAMLAAAAGENLHVVANETLEANVDNSAALARVLAKNPKVLYIGLATPGAAMVLSYLHAHHTNFPVWLVSADATRVAAKTLAPLLPDADVYSSTTKLALYDHLPFSDPQKQLLQQFVTMYQMREHGQTPDVFAVIAADAAEFIVAALRADHGVGGLLLMQSLERTPRAPGLYSWYHFGVGRHNGTELPGVIVRFTKDGSLEYITTIDDDQIPEHAHVWLHASRSHNIRAARISRTF